MKKRVWLVNYYAMPPKLESRLRTIKFAQYLKDEGYEVKIFASSVLHNKDENLINSKDAFIEKTYGDIDFVHIKAPNYKSNGLARFSSLILFHLRLHWNRKRFIKPDIIVHTALPPFGNITYFTAKKLKAKYIVEVLDLWPESFVSFGLIKKYNPIIPLAYILEKWLYKKADEVVFSMEGGSDYIIRKRWDKNNGGPIDLGKIHYINNGVDINDFDTNKKQYKINDSDLENNSFFKIIYIGSIRLANNLQRLIEAAEMIQDLKNVKVFIYGDGNDRKYLENLIYERNIKNVIFKERWVDPEFVPYILTKSDLNILNYLPNDIFQYGGSQSKLFQYLASGKPICSNLKMGYCLINKNNIGIAKEFCSTNEYADTLRFFVSLDKNSYNDMCQRSRQVALDFDYSTLTNQLISIF